MRIGLEPLNPVSLNVPDPLYGADQDEPLRVNRAALEDAWSRG